MAENFKCVYLSQRSMDDSPPGDYAELVYRRLVLPALEDFSFDMVIRGFAGPSSITPDDANEILLARDPVLIGEVVDLVALVPNAMNRWESRNTFLEVMLSEYSRNGLAPGQLR